MELEQAFWVKHDQISNLGLYLIELVATKKVLSIKNQGKNGGGGGGGRDEPQPPPQYETLHACYFPRSQEESQA